MDAVPRRPRALLARAGWHARPARPGPLHALLAESQWWPPDRIRALQAGLLRDVLAAAALVPFHAQRLRDAGLEPAEARAPEHVRALPPLEREDLQREGDGLRVPGRRGLRVASSGSVGRPVVALWPREMVAWFDANDRRCQEWFGIRLGERRLNVAASPSATRARRRAGAALANVVRIPSVEASDPAAVRRRLRALERDPPALVWGVSNGLYALALAALEAGSDVRARICVSEGNHLHEGYRETIEAAFGCPVVERYGSWETGIVAHECPHGTLHALAEGVVVEVVDVEGRPAAPGEVGDLLVTVLRNRAMPLLRYRIGDLAAAAAPGSCPCGRGLPAFGRLIGRANELLRTASGGVVAPEAVSAVMTAAAASVLEFQVVQGRDLRLDVKVVQRARPSPEPYRSQIAHALDGLLALPGATRIEPVERIPLDRAGKLRHVVSLARAAEPVPR